MEEQRAVDENEARALAENLGLKYFETSALTGHNVSTSVEALLDQVRSMKFITPHHTTPHHIHYTKLHHIALYCTILTYTRFN